jgi:hypothetical protein
LREPQTISHPVVRHQGVLVGNGATNFHMTREHANPRQNGGAPESLRNRRANTTAPKGKTKRLFRRALPYGYGQLPQSEE